MKVLEKKARMFLDTLYIKTALHRRSSLFQAALELSTEEACRSLEVPPDSLIRVMESRGGLTDEEVSAACKEGDAITMVSFDPDFMFNVSLT